MRATIIAAFALLLLGTVHARTLEVKGQEVPVCGGFPGFVCSDTDWCDYPQGTICGDVDQLGTCRPRPDRCIEQYLPVCGCDGETHANACVAAQKGSDVAYPGPCKGEGKE